LLDTEVLRECTIAYHFNRVRFYFLLLKMFVSSNVTLHPRFLMLMGTFVSSKTLTNSKLAVVTLHRGFTNVNAYNRECLFTDFYGG
jgi:hypothetical protein